MFVRIVVVVVDIVGQYGIRQRQKSMRYAHRDKDARAVLLADLQSLGLPESRAVRPQIGKSNLDRSVHAEPVVDLMIVEVQPA